MTKRITYLAGAITASACLAYVLYTVDPNRLLTALSSTKPVPVVLAVLVTLGHLGCKILRWQNLLRPLGNIGLARLAPPVFIGSLANFLVPHSGELARSIYIARTNVGSASAVLASIAAERVFDFVAILVLTIACLFLIPNAPQVIVDVAKALIVTCVVLLLGLVLVLARAGVASRAVNTLITLLPSRWQSQASAMCKNAISGLSALRSPELVARILVLSILQWVLMACCIYLCIHAVDAAVPFPSALVVLALTVFGLTLPTAPGYVGTLQICFIAGLGPFEIFPGVATAASIIYSFVIALVVLALGLGSLARAGRALDATNAAANGPERKHD